MICGACGFVSIGRPPTHTRRARVAPPEGGAGRAREKQAQHRTSSAMEPSVPHVDMLLPSSAHDSRYLRERRQLHYTVHYVTFHRVTQRHVALRCGAVRSIAFQCWRA